MRREGCFRIPEHRWLDQNIPLLTTLKKTIQKHGLTYLGALGHFPELAEIGPDAVVEFQPCGIRITKINLGDSAPDRDFLGGGLKKGK